VFITQQRSKLVRFSANLGLLFTDRPLVAAIRAAAKAGFQAVECHWPYQSDSGAVRAVLAETGLPMLSLNTVRGDADRAEFGLAALPRRQEEARAAIRQGMEYGRQIGAGNLHVMAGVAAGPEAESVFAENLRWAADQAASFDMTLLIEPINRHDLPGYFLQTIDQAAAIIDRLASPHIKIMFDCYHLQRQGGDLTHYFRHYQPLIGHVQFAGVPDRGPPTQGELDYKWLLGEFVRLGYQGWFGAEYRPVGQTEESLGWLADFCA